MLRKRLSHQKGVRALGALTIALTLGACADPDARDDDTLTQQDPALTVASMIDGGTLDAAAPEADAEAAMDGAAPVDAATLDGGKPQPNPNAAYFADITANGTGCPAGTWNTAISSDGTKFSTVFSSFAATVDKDKSIDVKDCMLSIKLHSPANLSFALRRVRYEGYAFLNTGVSARRLVKAYFQGNPDTKRDPMKTELTGPLDETYLIDDAVKTSDLVWSPCGRQRDLNVLITLRLENDKTRKDGYISVNKATDFELDWRRCTP